MGAGLQRASRAAAATRPVTMAERNLLLRLSRDSDISGHTFKFKGTLRMLSSLADKGMIDFQPFEGIELLTDCGKAELDKKTQHGK